MADASTLGACADRGGPHAYGVMRHDPEPVASQRAARVTEDEMYAFAKRVLADIEIVAAHVDHRALGRALASDQLQALLAGASEARRGQDVDGEDAGQRGVGVEALRRRIEESDLAGVTLSGCGYLEFSGDAAAVVAEVWNAVPALLDRLDRYERADGDLRD